MRVPLGPVAVYAASNFPFAFSTLGGDTASALAAGCTVVMKPHPGHPETSRLVGEIARRTIAEAGLPEGTFVPLPEIDVAASAALVRMPGVPRSRVHGAPPARGGRCSTRSDGARTRSRSSASSARSTRSC